MVFALAAPLAVGSAALGVETSFDYFKHTHLQVAADAAAYAAALENRAGSSNDTIKAAATSTAASNGWSATGGTIVVNTPPTTGPNKVATAVEVKLSQNVPRFFTAFFNDGAVTMHTRAVAVYQTAGNACILALNKTAGAAASFTGNTTVNLNGCDVMSNSVANDAVNVWGSAKLKADCVMSAGGVTNKAGMTLTGCAAPVTQAPRAKDPFAGVATPAQGVARTVPGGNVVALSPGYYSAGMDLKKTVTMAPGVYYVSGGDFKVNANANVTGTGVTIYMASGSHVNMNGNSHTALSAPTSGALSGILFFGDRAGSGSNTFNGDNASGFTGDLYFPTQTLSYLGNFSGASGCTHIVADTVTWSGSSTLSVDCSASGMQNIPARQAVKVVE